MNLINDEEGEAIFAGQGLEGLLELGQQAVKGMSRFKLEGQEDVGIQGSHIETGIGQVNQGREGAVEGLDKGADSGGFASADLTGDEGGQAFLQGISQAALNFLVSAGGEELVGRDISQDFTGGGVYFQPAHHAQSASLGRGQHDVGSPHQPVAQHQLQRLGPQQVADIFEQPEVSLPPRGFGRYHLSLNVNAYLQAIGLTCGGRDHYNVSHLSSPTGGIAISVIGKNRDVKR